ncbi:MAG: protein YgfX [Burkholderiales bacterium]
MIPITLKPSISLAAILATAHLGAIFLVLGLPISAKLPLVMLLAFSMVYSILRYALIKLPDSIVSLKLEEKSCKFSMRGGSEKICAFHGSTYVSPYLTVLNLKEEGRRLMKSVVILPDAIDREEFRQLRVWLRWKV